MRKYKLAVILEPEIKAEEREKLIDKIKKMVENKGGKVEKVDEWGKKEMAYPINKVSEGFYIVFIFSCLPEAVSDINQKVRLEEKIVRSLLVLNSEGR